MWQKNSISGLKQTLLRSINHHLHFVVLFSNIPMDKRILDDIEVYSRDLAKEFVRSVEQLTSSLHNMSATSVGCLQTYRDAVGEKLNETIQFGLIKM